jgi:hypothetical protein
MMTASRLTSLALSLLSVLGTSAQAAPEDFQEFMQETLELARAGARHRVVPRIQRATREASEALRQARGDGDVNAECEALGRLMAIASFEGKDISRIRYARAYVDASDRRDGIGSARALEARAEVARRLDERPASRRAASILRMDTARQILANQRGLGLSEQAEALVDLLQDADGPEHAALGPLLRRLATTLRAALDACDIEDCEGRGHLEEALRLAEAEAAEAVTP